MNRTEYEKHKERCRLHKQKGIGRMRKEARVMAIKFILDKYRGEFIDMFNKFLKEVEK
jgi:hypothetical protein